jgi:hypothetical protein
LPWIKTTVKRVEILECRLLGRNGESIRDLKISFGNFNDSFNHCFAAIDKIRLLEGRIFLEATIADDGQLGATKNYLRTFMLFFELLENDDEVIDDLFSFVARLNSIDNVLEKILVLFAWCYRLDIAIK